jgi:glycosyltransferase involved in cell wall biosynthesis
MQEKIKVCHIITMLELGGAQQNTIYTTAHLDQEKFNAYLLYGPGGMLTDDAKAALPGKTFLIPHLIRKIHPYYDTRAFFELYAVLKKLKPAIVHTHSSKAGIVGRTAARLAGVPIIIHSIHGFGYTKYQNILKYQLLKSAEWFVSKFTTYFIAVSNANLDQGIKEKLFDASRVILIRSGISLDSFRNAVPGTIREEFHIQEDQPLITMIACFKPQKAPVDFIKVADEVHKTLPNARFLLVGDGILRESIEDEIRQRNLAGIIKLTGWRREIPQIIAASDIIALTSLWEGLPRTIIESMAAGKPVVATGVDGTSDIIQDGTNGFLAAPHDIESFAKKILALLSDKTLQAEFSQSSQNILSEFDIDLMVKKQEQLYLHLLNSSGR